MLPIADRDGSEPVLRALLGRVCAAYPTSDLFVAPGTIPTDALRAQGFYPEDEPPLSYLRSGRPHLAKSLDSWAPAGQTLTDGDNWTTTFLELDTG